MGSTGGPKDTTGEEPDAEDVVESRGLGRLKRKRNHGKLHSHIYLPNRLGEGRLTVHTCLAAGRLKLEWWFGNVVVLLVDANG